jgi:hypothetical protein
LSFLHTRESFQKSPIQHTFLAGLDSSFVQTSKPAFALVISMRTLFIHYEIVLS